MQHRLYHGRETSPSATLSNELLSSVVIYTSNLQHNNVLDTHRSLKRPESTILPKFQYVLTKGYNFALTWHEPKNTLERTATAAVHGSSIYGPAYHPSVGERLRSSGSGRMNYGSERHADVDGVLPLYTFLMRWTFAAKRKETIWGTWMDGDAVFNCTMRRAISWLVVLKARGTIIWSWRSGRRREGSATEKHEHAKGRCARPEFNGRSRKV